MSTDDGVDTITAPLDKQYVKNESARGFNTLENFSHFRRHNNMSIKDYMVDFNLRLCKIIMIPCDGSTRRLFAQLY